jgi:hypothetical protein
MSIPFNTEAIMAALFKIAQGVNTAKPGNPGATPFNVMSRRWVHFNQVTPDMIPAFYQQQLAGRTIEGGVRGLPVHKMKVRWIVYLPGSQGPQDVVSPTINKYYDALSQALYSQSTSPRGISVNTLGGLCANCYEDGLGINDEGLLTTPSLIVIPITILTAI